MNNQADCRIGSVALWNNSAYVLVNGYDKASKTYTVTPLERPEHVIPEVVPSVVEAAAVEFFPPKSFAKRFPNPRIMDGLVSSGADQNLYGTVIDVSTGVPEDLVCDGIITINTSCVIEGTSRPLQDPSSVSPVTCVDYPVAVHLNHPNDIVEFQDIYFTGRSTEHHTELCTAGKAIVFRRCQFSSVHMFAVHIISKNGSSTSKKLKSINVIFENCVFTNCASRPLLVEYPGKVLLLNSTFTNNTKNTSDGSAIFDGGSVVARHCTFRDENGGFTVWGANSSLDLQYCTFTRIKAIVMDVEDRASVTLKACFFQFCDMFLVNGPRRSKLYMENCKLLDFETGLYIRKGKTDVMIIDCEIRGAMFGLSVHFDVIGNIDIVSSSIVCTTDTVKNRNIKSGPKCLITVDGEVLPPPPLKLIIAEAKKNLDMFELDQMRRNKKAGVGPVAHWPDGHRDMCYMEVEPEGDSNDDEGKGEDEEDSSSVDG
eukprot:gene8839-10454_t